MKDVRRWFGWMILVLIAHVSEQLLFGIDELQEFKQVGAVYYSWFSNPDYGTVVMVGLIVLVVMSFVFTAMFGGKWRLIPVGFFGVSGIIEVHHIVKTFLQGSYFPGAITAVAFVTVGALLLRAVIREWRTMASARTTAAIA
jgi:hypothetical protein